MSVILRASRSSILSATFQSHAALASPILEILSLKHFSCSGTTRLKEILETERTSSDGKIEVVIEGVIKESERKEKLALLPHRLQLANSQMNCCSQHADCHPLCKLDFVHKIKHTGKLSHVCLMIICGKVMCIGLLSLMSNNRM